MRILGLTALVLTLAGCNFLISERIHGEGKALPKESSGVEGAYDSEGLVGPRTDSITATVRIDADDDPVRVVTGLRPEDMYSTWTGQINFFQLIVVEERKEGPALFSFHESRRAEQKWAVSFTLKGLSLVKNYRLLALLGHQERDYGKPGFEYKEGLPPTLLYAGLAEIGETEIRAQKTTINLYPVVVDTVFTAKQKAAEPLIRGDGKPGPVVLDPGNWTVEWTLREGKTSPGGFDRLLAAQMSSDASPATVLMLKSAVFGIWKSGLPEISSASSPANTALSRHELHLNIGNLGDPAPEGVYFKLEYVPFNLTGSDWSAYKGVSKLDLSNGPVWIIRNGLNDDLQDKDTDYKALGTAAGTAAGVNGNGAIRILRSGDDYDGDGFPNGWEADEGTDPLNENEHPNPQEDLSLTITNGAFKGSGDTASEAIEFTTSGYTGNAAAYYAAVGRDTPAPSAVSSFSSYAAIPGSLAAGTYEKTIGIAGTWNKGYDVYLILFKDGKVSAPFKLRTSWGPGDPGRFVAISKSFPKDAWWSIDKGENWTRAKPLPEGIRGDLRCIAYDSQHGAFVVLGEGASYGTRDLIRSTDGGNTWVLIKDGLPSAAMWTDLSYGDGLLVASGGYFENLNPSKDLRPIFAWSNDGGASWTQGTVDWTEETSVVSISYGGRAFVGIIRKPGSLPSNAAQFYAVKSTDRGQTWNKRGQLPDLSNQSGAWNSIAYGNGVFAVIGYTPSGDDKYTTKTLWSDDSGETWHSETGENGGFLQTVSYGNGIFTALSKRSDMGSALWSTDGKAWTKGMTLSSGEFCHFRTAYGNGIFMSSSLVSTDGKEWTAKTRPFPLWAVTYGEPPAAAPSP